MIPLDLLTFIKSQCQYAPFASRFFFCQDKAETSVVLFIGLSKSFANTSSLSKMSFKIITVRFAVTVFAKLLKILRLRVFLTSDFLMFLQ